MTVAQDEVRITLSQQEAVAFFSFLMRFRDDEKLSIECEADRQILYDVCGLVQNEIGSLLLHDEWSRVLSEAQAAVVAGEA